MYSLKPRAIIHISEQLVVECRLIRKSVYSHNNFVCVCVWVGVGGWVWVWQGGNIYKGY